MTDSTAGGDGGGGVDFLTSLPAEMQSDGVLKPFAGPDGGAKLAKSYSELQRTFHSRSMADMEPPQDDAGRRAVLSKLGHAAPDSPDGYKLPDKASAPAFRALAHQHGLSAKQAEAMFADMEASDARMSGERETRNGARKAETEQKLRGEWGDQYDANKEIVKRGTEDHVPELNKIMEQLGLDQHPEWQKMLYGVGRHSQEGTMHTGTGAVTGPADKAGFRAERVKLESQLSDMKKQPGFDPINTGYRQLMSERDGMLRKEAEAHIADQAKAGVTP